jgi:hypothetical protein
MHTTFFVVVPTLDDGLYVAIVSVTFKELISLFEGLSSLVIFHLDGQII